MSQASSTAQRAFQIWKAGVRAVDSETLVSQAIQVTDQELTICGHKIPLKGHERLLVTGAGKAGSGMAAGVESALRGSSLSERTSGWVNVPADCVRPLSKIHLYPARPASLNEPTAEGVYGARQILQKMSDLQPDDICIVLISGGGSALLPAPLPPVTLEDKQRVTRLLMSSGATIQELNCVRKQISAVKGGRLAQAAGCRQLFALIISDIVGDPLDLIASGPTVADESTAQDALQVLQRFVSDPAQIPDSVWSILKSEQTPADPQKSVSQATVFNQIIGSNATALEAASEQAQALGYEVYSLGSANEGTAIGTGVELAELCLQLQAGTGPVQRPACILSGGEPVVDLSSSPNPGKGGRNQELVLAAMERLWDESLSGFCILSGGTDGEDGPTDAAGGILDELSLKRAHERGLDPALYLRDHNAYPILAATGSLLKTGATQTNVMDLRVAIVD
ncbi:glycerate kinase type-2 family protein [Gimesia sp.]|uniref:glycerate kinase type-2 family protein n=1 Tax=Gimesia sp. TaxID=2024833 RepID=UPI003A8E170C